METHLPTMCMKIKVNTLQKLADSFSEGRYVSAVTDTIRYYKLNRTNSVCDKLYKYTMINRQTLNVTYGRSPYSLGRTMLNRADSTHE